MKQALYKVVGSAKLTIKELQDVMLDIQLVLNNRPLSYCEDDVQLPVLTPNMMIFGKANYLMELTPEDIIPAPPQSNLPKERTEGEIPLEVTGVDYAAPIYYKGNGGADRKSYIVICTCSLTRGVHLEILPDMSCDEFLMSFERFIAARGRPKKIISDNGKTFVDKESRTE